jgi:hypothetical protein
MRPVPSYFVIFGDTENVIRLFKRVSNQIDNAGMKGKHTGP